MALTVDLDGNADVLKDTTVFEIMIFKELTNNQEKAD